NRALILLRRGAWQEGWRDYEARFIRSDEERRELEAPLPRVPKWRGEPLAGKRILLRSEQGLGDAIQFVRFAPLLKGKGAAVFLSVPTELVAPFRTVDGVEGVCPRGRERRLEPLDYWTPLLSLGGLLNIT